MLTAHTLPVDFEGRLLVKSVPITVYPADVDLQRVPVGCAVPLEAIDVLPQYNEWLVSVLAAPPSLDAMDSKKLPPPARDPIGRFRKTQVVYRAAPIRVGEELGIDDVYLVWQCVN